MDRSSGWGLVRTTDTRYSETRYPRNRQPSDEEERYEPVENRRRENRPRDRIRSGVGRLDVAAQRHRRERQEGARLALHLLERRGQAQTHDPGPHPRIARQTDPGRYLYRQRQGPFES